MTEDSKAHFVFKPIIRGMVISENTELFPIGKVYCVGKNYADHAKEMGGKVCLLYTSPSPRDGLLSRMPSSA